VELISDSLPVQRCERRVGTATEREVFLLMCQLLYMHTEAGRWDWFSYNGSLVGEARLTLRLDMVTML
jgi:hypothetical protein